VPCSRRDAFQKLGRIDKPRQNDSVAEVLPDSSGSIVPSQDGVAIPRGEEGETEGPDRDEGEMEEQVRDDLTWCIGNLYKALQTSVWLGRLRDVQAIAWAIGRLDHLIKRLEELSSTAPDQ
jgi:hypothetical protein